MSNWIDTLDARRAALIEEGVGKEPSDIPDTVTLTRDQLLELLANQPGNQAKAAEEAPQQPEPDQGAPARVVWPPR